MLIAPRPRSSLSMRFYPVMLRIFLFITIWFILSKGEMSGGLPFAIPCILTACMLAMQLRRAEPFDFHLGLLLVHLPFFLYKSTMSGLDVMRRALHPAMPIAPVLVEFHFSLPPGNPRIFLADIITLLPGTISADMDDEKILIHALDPKMALQSELRHLEKKVARLYRLGDLPKTGTK